MQLKIHSRTCRPSSVWVGGVTTELWIFPQDGNYGTRNFKARISSATVSLKESDFTELPDVIRYITPLSGKFVLTHPNGQTIAMMPLDEPYRFDGGVATHCSGTATDFNLMLKGVDGYMKILRGAQTLDNGLYCVYPLNGAELKVNGKSIDINSGDLVEIRTESGERSTLESPEAILCGILI